MGKQAQKMASLILPLFFQKGRVLRPKKKCLRFLVTARVVPEVRVGKIKKFFIRYKMVPKTCQSCSSDLNPDAA